MSKLSRSVRAVGGLLLFLVWAAGLSLTVYAHRPIAQAVPRLMVPKGAGLASIAEGLRRVGAARSPWATRWAFRLWGSPGRAKAGVYAFPKGTRLVDIFRAIEEGRVDLVQITLPEGLTAREMAPLLQAAGVTSAAEFAAFALDPASPRLWGLPGPSLEGFLFPDTYRFAREISARTVAGAMVRRFRQVAGEVTAGKPVPDLLSWVTLASIVEKETGQQSEKPLVAAVFRNRLRIGMPLQSDPTVIYGIARFDGNLRRDDLRRDAPFNTYVRRGLPPGAISNPGRLSLAAVLHPADVPYLYFVSQNDGTHVFSQDYADHARAVVRFQKRGGR